MKRHKKIYKEFFNLSEDEYSPCERCVVVKNAPIQRAVDVHHTDFRGMGGDQAGDKDDITKLVGLCRSCHDVCEACPGENEVMKEWAKRSDDRLEVIRILMYQQA